MQTSLLLIKFKYRLGRSSIWQKEEPRLAQKRNHDVRTRQRSVWRWREWWLL